MDADEIIWLAQRIRRDALAAAAQTASTYEPTYSVLTRADHFAHYIATGEITAGATDQPKP